MPINHIENLRAVLAGVSRVLILPHNDPDPDAIASALGLSHLLAEKFQLESGISYKGFIGRAENRALVKYLGEPLFRLSKGGIQTGEVVALVDTQPGAGNNPLPEGYTPAIVIDHHSLAAGTGSALYADVRPELGATSTILVEYLEEAEIELPAHLATALFYGIKTDTKGLSRNAKPEDVSAYFYLQTRIDVNALAGIEQAQVPLAYFKSLDNAIHAAKIYDKEILIAYLGESTYPDQCAEIADLLMRLRGINWVFCMGVFNKEFILSVRTLSRMKGAGKLVRDILKDKGAAGGHGMMAAGHIDLKVGDDPGQIAANLEVNILRYLKGTPDIPYIAMM